MLTAVETRTESGAKPSEPAVVGSFEPVHCRKCRRMLFRSTARALRASEMIETKCPKCNAMNYLVGSDENVVDKQQ